MPTLSLNDGSSLTWEEAVPVTAEPYVEPLMAAAPEPVQATPQDVKAALEKVPPKWVASAWRFVRTLIAAVVAAVAAYGGDVAALLSNPKALGALVLTAVISAGDKFIRWKEE